MTARYKPNRYFDNARLATDLAIELKATGTDAGSLSNFSKTDPEWICPACARNKRQIARLNKNGDLYCALHLHHDHIEGAIAERLGIQSLAPDHPLWKAVQLHARFRAEYICMDCNRADGQAKKMAGAPEHFSFSAREIYEFVMPRKGHAHIFHSDAVTEIFATALPVYERILARVEGSFWRDFPELMDKHAGHIEPIGHCAWRVLKEANANRKAPK